MEYFYYIQDNDANIVPSDGVITPNDYCISVDGQHNYNEDVRITESIVIRRQTISSSGGASEHYIRIPYLMCFCSCEYINDINRAIYHLVVAPFIINEYFPGVGMLEIDYEITYLDEYVISIRFFGFTGGWRGTNNIQTSINASFDNGKILSLGDFFTSECLVEIIEKIAIGDNITFADQYFQYNEMLRVEILEHVHLYFYNLLLRGDLIYNSESFYIRDNKLGLIGEPLPSFRNYILIEMKLCEIKQR